jgi:hypothetical protein
VPKRWMIIVIGILSACCLALSVWAGMWWSVGETGIGPLGTTMCTDAGCATRGLAWLRPSEAWLRSANATAGAGVIAMVVVLIVAGAAAARRTPKLAARGCIAAMVTAIAVGIYFIARFPGFQGASIDRGAILYFVGTALGLVTAILVLRVKPTPS